MKKEKNINNMILSALFLALAYVMPFITGQIPQIGKMLCPLHIPIILCGFFCGWKWGFAVGFIAPLLRSLTLGMPQLFPNAVCMTFELAAYGAAAGLLYNLLPKRKMYIYISLLAAMLTGRIIWGIAMLVCMGIKGDVFTVSAFIAGAFVNSIPGIIIQIVLIPILVMTLDNPKIK